MTSSTPLHLQPFTLLQNRSTETKSFYLFPQLPRELRNKIWHHSMQRSRIFHMSLHDLDKTPPKDIPDIPTSTDNQRFFAVTEGQQSMSKLFRVNQEARVAALFFYRVRIPCWFRIGSVDDKLPLKPGQLYFNPEHDFLRLTAKWSVKHTLFPFLYLFNTVYDPSHTGLRNLIFYGNDLSGNDLQLMDCSTADLDAHLKEVFTDTIKNLHQVFFFTNGCLHSRQFAQGGGQFLLAITQYNRSIPIETRVPSFDSVPRDPRAIGEDLKDVMTHGDDHRRPFRLWTNILGKWGLSATSLGIEYKWSFGFKPDDRLRILGRETARRFMQKEDNYWNGTLDAEQERVYAEQKLEVGAQSEKYKGEDLERAVRPAFGFWLFPIEALDSVDDEGQYTRYSDLSKYWPELWLSSLPESG
ncbi:hypothetical protein GLAREA_04911 [Glarea lozoyensis ATCC 20868]|uniref:2EXR domain-containing protein n=1 Tax=Glarea lozoyensis (strain ATCC 20868 / MF5171) TaxID=1116229 RepID=S3CR18_GLAL2|nr:uncharacterized protein GLAREA_04911 [Glarea lozoyensis ATCC 20868]EPE28120.1 hypothetical protein GLAREA_04911 [Glarea lozoyensis ATCC 20868]